MSGANDEAAEDLLERLADAGIPCDDLSVADVTSKASPARFIRVASRLAADVSALAPAAGSDDPAGVEAAAAAVYRSAAAAGDNPKSAAARVEQGLRRMAAAVDRTSPAHHCTTIALLEILVTYVQVATMLARRRASATAPPDATHTPMDTSSSDGPGAGAGFDAASAPPAAPPLDPAQRVRVSDALRRLADGLSGDDGVVAAAEPKHKGTAPSALGVVDAAVSAVARAFASLPADHRARIFPDGVATSSGLTPNQRETLGAVSEALAREYATRKETVARRAGVTVQSFGYSPRLRDSPEVTRDFARRAGAGGAQAQGRDALPVDARVGLEEVWDARVADLARAVQRTNAEASRTLDASVKRVLIGSVPDRGGRTEGGGARDDMPAFAARAAGGEHTVGGGGRGREGGGGRKGKGRGGGGRGRGGRGKR
jgi:hypothetical protein